MKKYFLLFLVTIAFAAIVFNKQLLLAENEKLEALQEQIENETPEKMAEMTRARLEYEYDLLKDPSTGKIPANIGQLELAQAMTIPTTKEYQQSIIQAGIVRGTNGVSTPTTNNYLPAGPTNLGGRTRVLAFDKRYNGTTNKIMLAGCVSGGIMRSADGGISWTLVTPDKQIHSLTALAQDTRAGFENTWYAGTGESLGNSTGLSGSFYLGNGIYKSIDNGLTWTALTSTQTGLLESFDKVFDLIHRIAVNPANGDVYVACQNTIERSKDGGATWTAVKGVLGGNSATGNSDVVINSTGTKIYCAFHLKNTTDRGVWESATGDLNSWTLLGGNVAGTPAGWQVNNGTSSWGRIVLQLAPSNNNLLYVLYENGQSQASPTLLPEVDMFKIDLTSGTPVFTNLSINMPDMPGNNKSGSDPIAVQGGYDMLFQIKPDDANAIFVGGTNLYRSTNGFATSLNTSWIGGYATDFTTYHYLNSHPDMHYLAFDPTNSKRAFCCNDAGIQVTEDITAAKVVWTFLSNYQTLQYYYVAIDPESGKNNFVGGAQDNGTWYRDASLNFGTRTIDRPGINDYINLFGGDGVAVDIAKINGSQQLTYFGAQSGIIVRDELLNNATYPGLAIKPKVADLTSNGSTGYGDFVTNFKLSNSNSEVLFYANYNKLFKTNQASLVDSTKWTRLSGVETTVNILGNTAVSIRAMDFSWGPYQTTHAMYFGTNTGKIYRLDNYVNANGNSIPVDITPALLNASSGNVQDIAVNPNDDNEIMAVVSNYGVTSIWWTYNAKSPVPSWSNAEGNLTLPSVRTCAIVVKKDANNNPVTEYYVGTSVGLYTTSSIGQTLGAGGTIVWSREGATVLNYAVISSLDYRPEDNTLLIGTHGNGMYYTTIGSANFTPNQPTAIATVLNDKNFISIFPTISKGVYQYQPGTLNGIQSVNIQAYNLLGQLIFQEQGKYTRGNISLSKYPAGTYIVKITSSDRKYQTIQKIIKQ